MKNILIGGIIILMGCSPKINQEINFVPKYINKTKVEEGIKGTGVRLNLSNEYSNGKGLLKIKDSSSNEGEESIFTLVRYEVYEDGEMEIINEVPTIEGLYEIRVLIKDNKQKSSFRIVKNWKNKIEFIAKSSSVKMNKPLNSSGLICIELFYKGQELNSNRMIELKNEFYLQINN